MPARLSEKGDRGADQAERSLCRKKRLDCGKQLYETVRTRGIEGIAFEAIDTESAGCTNLAGMESESEQIIHKSVQKTKG
jgi:hypothetical protein